MVALLDTVLVDTNTVDLKEQIGHRLWPAGLAALVYRRVTGLNFGLASSYVDSS